MPKPRSSARLRATQTRSSITSFEPLWTVKDVAFYLKLHERTVTRKNLPSVLFGSARRYRPEDIRRYVDAHCTALFGQGEAR